MSDSEWTQERKLTNRIVDVLHWKQCTSIRFQLEMVTIQSFMYLHIANAVREGSITVKIDPARVPHYDPDAAVISMPKADVEPYVIVHEATHAVIFTTHREMVLNIVTHEAAAYLAEAVFSMNFGNKPRFEYLPGVYDVAWRLAGMVKFHNDRSAGGLFECPLGLVWGLKDALRHSGLGQLWDARWWQGGVPPAPGTHTQF